MTSLTGSSTNLSAPPGLQPRAEPRRLYELDSLRGLAALSVVILHCSTLWKEEVFGLSNLLSQRIFQALIQPISAGHEAVILFFILSGLVLSIPAVEQRPKSYPVFLARRVFRIYFPYLCALMLAVAGNALFSSPVTHSDWFNLSWNSPIQLKPILENIAFIGDFDPNQFNPPIWSLVYEMRISMLFPAICWFALAVQPYRALVLAIGLSVASSFIPVSSQAADNFLGTISCVSYFVIGICLARYSVNIHDRFRKLSNRTKLLLFLLTAFLYFYAGRILIGYVPLDQVHLNTSLVSNCVTTFAAAFLIVFSINSQSLRNLLLTKPLRWLGEMSYSLYLTHFIVLLFLVHLLNGRMNFNLLIVLCLVASLAFARIFFLAVERPFMNMGRRLTRKPETLQAPKQSSP